MSASSLRLREGLSHPRGATWDDDGVNFSLFSANATKVELGVTSVELLPIQSFVQDSQLLEKGLASWKLVIDTNQMEIAEAEFMTGAIYTATGRSALMVSLRQGVA